MAKKAGFKSCMTVPERALGGVLLAVYLVALPFASGPLFQGLERLLGHGISPEVRGSVCCWGLLALALAVFWRSIGRTTGHFLSAALPALSAAGMGLVVFYGLDELAYRLFRLVSAGQTDLSGTAVSAQVLDLPGDAIFLTVFAVPLIEELLFRGYVFGALRDYSRIAAYIVSCLLYALPHAWQFAMVDRSIASFLWMIQYLSPGAVLAWSYERSGTLWSSILVHCFVNAMAVL